MKLVFLFMIYDIIEKEDLWKQFFKDVNENKFNIYIHAKDNNKVNLSDDFKKFLLNKNYPTEWGTFSLVYLQNRLLEESIKDKENYKFIFLSGSHIPLHTFDYLYNFLTLNDNSYFHYFQINRQSNLFKKRICSINNTIIFFNFTHNIRGKFPRTTPFEITIPHCKYFKTFGLTIIYFNQSPFIWCIFTHYFSLNFK